MLRVANLRVEVFIDEYDDGSIRAEAMMLRVDDRRVFAQGSATFHPAGSGAAGIDDEVIASWALFDLAQKLIHDAPSPGGARRRSFAGTITSDGATLSVARPADAASADEGDDSPAVPGPTLRRQR
ncbi:MAG TPA: dsRBD fold-containing protein [Actinoplanes sp.]|nr:dsRBD fold-containing protein [Actinoplanes sp.]